MIVEPTGEGGMEAVNFQYGWIYLEINVGFRKKVKLNTVKLLLNFASDFAPPRQYP
jgi:hypothetical protein